MTRDTDRTASAPEAGERFSLRRWSRRKLAAAREAEAPTSAPSEAPPGISAAPPPPAATVAGADPVAALPPVESLTFDSDFRAFLQPNVPEPLKQQALRKLLHDPRFNVMDGLDVYIDDYSIPSPLEPELVQKMIQARYIFDPPATRINAAGHVEDVPAAAEQGEGVASTAEIPAAALVQVESSAAPVESMAALDLATPPPGQDQPAQCADAPASAEAMPGPRPAS